MQNALLYGVPHPIFEKFRLAAGFHDSAMNTLSKENASLSKELDNLSQYTRRENICFTNLAVDDDHTCEEQVTNLCHELGVEVTHTDLVAVHPFKTKKVRKAGPDVLLLDLRTES